MAGNFIKVTILFVVIYQVTKLNEATTLNRPSSDDTQSSNENQLSTGDVSDTSTLGEIANPPTVEETSESPVTAETSDPSPLGEPSPSSAADENVNPLPDPSTGDNDPTDETFTPTDPLEINKIAFQPLTTLFGNIGPLIYDLLTDKNALGEQMAVVSKLISDKISLSNYSEDIGLILSNLLNPTVKGKVQEIYSKIEDVEPKGTTNRKLRDAVEIIMNIFEDGNTIDEIRNIIKTSPV